MLTGIAAELATETIKETTTEAVAESIKETTAETIKIKNTDAAQVSFGSLADGKLEFNENYLKWKDGISKRELKPEWIEELTNEIAEIYGIDDIGALKYRFDNAGIVTEYKKLIYDPKFLKEAGNEYGIDSVIEILSHEVGHQVFHDTGLESALYEELENSIYDEIFEKVNNPDKLSYINEACADYIAGLTTRLCKINPEHILSWYDAKGSEISLDGVHPGRTVRTEMFARGYSRLDRGAEAKTLKIFEDFSIYDLEGTYKNFDTLKTILKEDVINPILSGEIKPV